MLHFTANSSLSILSASLVIVLCWKPQLERYKYVAGDRTNTRSHAVMETIRVDAVLSNNLTNFHAHAIDHLSFTFGFGSSDLIFAWICVERRPSITAQKNRRL